MVLRFDIKVKSFLLALSLLTASTSVQANPCRNTFSIAQVMVATGVLGIGSWVAGIALDEAKKVRDQDRAMDLYRVGPFSDEGVLSVVQGLHPEVFLRHLDRLIETAIYRNHVKSYNFLKSRRARLPQNLAEELQVSLFVASSDNRDDIFEMIIGEIDSRQDSTEVFQLAFELPGLVNLWAKQERVQTLLERIRSLAPAKFEIKNIYYSLSIEDAQELLALENTKHTGISEMLLNKDKSGDFYLDVDLNLLWVSQIEKQLAKVDPEFALLGQSYLEVRKRVVFQSLLEKDPDWVSLEKFLFLAKHLGGYPGDSAFLPYLAKKKDFELFFKAGDRMSGGFSRHAVLFLFELLLGQEKYAEIEWLVKQGYLDLKKDTPAFNRGVGTQKSLQSLEFLKRQKLDSQHH